MNYTCSSNKKKEVYVKKIRIYKLRFAIFLQERGFQVVDCVQDLQNPYYKNWYFEDTPALRKAMTDYTSEIKRQKRGISKCPKILIFTQIREE